MTNHEAMAIVARCGALAGAILLCLVAVALCIRNPPDCIPVAIVSATLAVCHSIDAYNHQGLTAPRNKV